MNNIFNNITETLHRWMSHENVDESSRSGASESISFTTAMGITALAALATLAAFFKFGGSKNFKASQDTTESVPTTEKVESAFAKQIDSVPSSAPVEVSTGEISTFVPELMGLVPTLVEEKIIPSNLVVKNKDGQVDAGKTLQKIQKELTVPQYVYMRQLPTTYEDSNKPFLDFIDMQTVRDTEDSAKKFKSLLAENQVINYLDYPILDGKVCPKVFPMTYAVERGQHKAVEAFLKCGVNPYQRRTSGNGKKTETILAMEVAITTQDKDMVLLLLKYVIDKAADLGIPSQSGLQVLSIALTKGKKEIAAILLDNGAPVNKPDQYSVYPLGYAATANDVETGKLIWALAPEAEQADMSIGAIEDCLRHGSSEFLAFILEKIPDSEHELKILSALNFIDTKPLKVRVEGKRIRELVSPVNVNIVQMALNNIKDKNNTETMTQLKSELLIKSIDNVELFKVLVEQGCSLDPKNFPDYTHPFITVAAEKNLELLKSLSAGHLHIIKELKPLFDGDDLKPEVAEWLDTIYQS